ncbi:MAG: extracellular solute-binding protein [Gammaproteobacteria bacterium]|nr:MAG: extracellular solute-binding protein [Gammaproteobacteria bacterium]
MRLLAYIFVCLSLLACERSEKTSAEPDVLQLSVWAHAGQAGERLVIEKQLQAFDRLHDDIRVNLTFIPERSYNAQVQAAAIAGALPDLLEFDVPYLYNYAWQGRLQPLENLLSADLQRVLLPSIIKQGQYQGHLYAVGTFDSGLALYARRSLLEKIDARIPSHPEQAWSVQEFEQILQRLAAIDDDGAVLDLKLNYPDEWFSYGFSPVLQSAGGDLIDRSNYQKSNGILNGTESVAAMSHIQRWLSNGWVDVNVDDAAFIGERVALSWAGHWEYQRYHEAFGDDLLLLPLPDYSQGSRTGQGSWVWGISRNTAAADKAVQVIEYLMRPEQILAMIDANGAVPATHEAIERSSLYQKGGPLHLFTVQLAEGYAVPRPLTPAYPVISASFRQAFADIRNGMPVQQALDRAAAKIDEDIHDNRGYPPIESH